MRLRLFLINRQIVWGGGEYWTLRAAQELLQRGHEVRVLATRDSPLAIRVQAAGIPLLAVPPRIRSWFHFKRSLRVEWSRTPPDLLVANALLDLTLVNWIQGPGYRAPVLFVRGQDSPVGHRLTQRSRFRWVNRVVGNSEATCRSFRQSVPWFPADRIHRVLRGLETDPFTSYSDWKAVESERARLGLQEGAPVIGIFGRLEHQKGHHLLLQALTRLPQVQLLAVGRGSLEARLKGLAEEMGLQARCRWVGQVADIRPFLALCDLAVVPSLFEGFCLAAVEAQLMGKPVVASRVSSLPEVIEDGKTGVLVPVGDVPALSEAVQDLLQSHPRRLEMGASGRRIAARRFEFGKRFEDFMEVLARVTCDPLRTVPVLRRGRQL